MGILNNKNNVEQIKEKIKIYVERKGGEMGRLILQYYRTVGR